MDSEIRKRFNYLEIQLGTSMLLLIVFLGFMFWQINDKIDQLIDDSVVVEVIE